MADPEVKPAPDAKTPAQVAQDKIKAADVAKQEADKAKVEADEAARDAVLNKGIEAVSALKYADKKSKVALDQYMRELKPGQKAPTVDAWLTDKKATQLKLTKEDVGTVKAFMSTEEAKPIAAIAGEPWQVAKDPLAVEVTPAQEAFRIDIDNITKAAGAKGGIVLEAYIKDLKKGEKIPTVEEWSKTKEGLDPKGVEDLIALSKSNAPSGQKLAAIAGENYTLDLQLQQSGGFPEWFNQNSSMASLGMGVLAAALMSFLGVPPIFAMLLGLLIAGFTNMMGEGSVVNQLISGGTTGPSSETAVDTPEQALARTPQIFEHKAKDEGPANFVLNKNGVLKDMTGASLAAGDLAVSGSFNKDGTKYTITNVQLAELNEQNVYVTKPNSGTAPKEPITIEGEPFKFDITGNKEAIDGLRGKENERLGEKQAEVTKARVAKLSTAPEVTRDAENQGLVISVAEGNKEAKYRIKGKEEFKSGGWFGSNSITFTPTSVEKLVNDKWTATDGAALKPIANMPVKDNKLDVGALKDIWKEGRGTSSGTISLVRESQPLKDLVSATKLSTAPEVTRDEETKGLIVSVAEGNEKAKYRIRGTEEFKDNWLTSDSITFTPTSVEKLVNDKWTPTEGASLKPITGIPVDNNKKLDVSAIKENQMTFSGLEDKPLEALVRSTKDRLPGVTVTSSSSPGQTPPGNPAAVTTKSKGPNTP